jgi:hypothetical protein
MAPMKLASHRIEDSKDDIQQLKALIKTKTPMTEIGNQMSARLHRPVGEPRPAAVR